MRKYSVIFSLGNELNQQHAVWQCLLGFQSKSISLIFLAQRKYHLHRDRIKTWQHISCHIKGLSWYHDRNYCDNTLTFQFNHAPRQ